jgi:hypothetical protein
LQSHYSILYELSTNKNILVSQAIGYNRFYLIFNRPLNHILQQQLETLYCQLVQNTLNNDPDILNEDGIILASSALVLVIID